MNKKIKPCENQEFLPKEVAESTKANLDTAQKNLLGTLCFYYLNHSIYAAEHDGWFFKDQKTIFEESNLSPAEGKRVVLKLVFKKLIERASGTNHKCTHYKLHPKITELMPKNPEFFTEVPDEKIANEPLEKKRLDESSKDESRIDKENVVLETAFKEAAPSQPNYVEMLKKFKEDFSNAKSKQELIQIKKDFLNSGVKIPDEYWGKAENIFNSFNIKMASVRN